MEGDKAGHTIIKSEIISGTPDKIGVESKDGVTTITWVGGDTGAAGGAAGEKGPRGDKGETGDKGAKGETGDKGAKGETGDKGAKGETGDKGAKGDKGEKGDAGRQVIEGHGITATVDSANDTLTIAAKTKPNGGISAQSEGLSIDTDNATIKVDDAGKVAAVTGTITAGETPSVATADANKLAKAGEVAEAIKAAKTSVTNADATTTVTQDGNVYKVAAKVAENKGLDKTTDGLAVKQGSGITVNNDGVSVHAKDNGGLTVGTDGVSVNTDGTTIKLDDAGKVSAVTGAITAGDNAGVAEADKGKLAKAGEVVAAINKAKTKVVAGSGIKVTSSGNEYTVSADLPFTKNADKSISLNEEGVIRNVANGRVAKDSKDAVNGSQLHAVERRLSGNMDKLNHRIDKVGKRADAGTASAIATANLLQSYRPGLSAATAAVGEYRGQSAVAVGYSRLSDNGKYGVKLSLGANTQGNVGAGAGVAYFW